MNKRVLRVVSALNVLVYRLSRGKWMGRFPSGAPVCLLTTKAANLVAGEWCRSCISPTGRTSSVSHGSSRGC